MSWPNSVSTARPLPGLPSTFPGVPANDNWRMPRTNYRPPMPANDNFVRASRGIALPGVARILPKLAFRAIPVVGWALFAWDLYNILRPTGREYWDFTGWDLDVRCPANSAWDSLYANGPYTSCRAALPTHVLDGGAWNSPNTVTVGIYDRPHSIGGYAWTYQYGTYTRPSPTVPDPQKLPELAPAPAPVPRPLPAPAPYPGFFPPLLNPPFTAPPPLKPGLYKGPTQIMGEWDDSGYSAPQTHMERRETYLPSRRPPSRTKERKVRAKDYAIGRTIEWLVSQSTEGLDFQRALFEALPWWRKIALYNAARQLETRYADGRIVAGRLHYRDLTPIEKAQAIYDYIDEIDAAKAVENAVKMQLTDMFWAEIGQRMGRYQTGPWDDHGFDGPPKPEPEWQWYIPDIAPDNTHNHWTYETLVNKRLTQKEAQRIHTQFDQFRSAPYQERNFR